MAGIQPPGLVKGLVVCWPRMMPPAVVWNHRSMVNGVVRLALGLLLVGKGKTLSGSALYLPPGPLTPLKTNACPTLPGPKVTLLRVPFCPAEPPSFASPSPRHQLTASLLKPPLSVAVMVMVAAETL